MIYVIGVIIGRNARHNKELILILDSGYQNQ